MPHPKAGAQLLDIDACKHRYRIASSTSAASPPAMTAAAMIWLN
jgi:hypothetical protein